METPSPQFLEVLDETALPEGAVETVQVGNHKVALVRFQGAVHALDNVCPHLGGSLGRGTLQGGALACPLHHWTFELSTGKCISGAAGEKVALYEVKTEGGKILLKVPSA